MKKISGCASYYKTDNENEYINIDGDSIFRFNKITKKKVFYNSDSIRKFEDDKWFNIKISQTSDLIINRNETLNHFQITFQERVGFSFNYLYYLLTFHNKPYSCYKNNKYTEIENEDSENEDYNINKNENY
tara:strand:- start:1198 stop:1590 length:393 start_codon:yes stop_codon:yes gene_type:complete